jgi:putative PIN family toxin of toxin-antitoxin system
MDVVLDANVLVSGFSFGGGVPDRILRRWKEGQFRLIVSSHLLAEVGNTLEKPYFRSRLSESSVQQALLLLRIEARTTLLTNVVSGVATHPEDDSVLATAVSASCDYLVTGDRQLQHLGSYQGVRIVSPREFLTLVERLEQDDETEL